jgi:hypothetical protein
MTYLDLVQNIELFTITHPTLGTFSHGEIPALNASTRSHNDLPILNVRLVDFSISTPNNSVTQVVVYSIEVTILDVLLQDRSNEVFILNNLIQVIRDFYTQPFIFNNLTSELLATPGPYYLTENLFGFQLTLDIEVPLGDAFCI